MDLRLAFAQEPSRYVDFMGRDFNESGVAVLALVADKRRRSSP